MIVSAAGSHPGGRLRGGGSKAGRKVSDFSLIDKGFKPLF